LIASRTGVRDAELQAELALVQLGARRQGPGDDQIAQLRNRAAVQGALAPARLGLRNLGKKRCERGRVGRTIHDTLYIARPARCRKILAYKN
jgi:hypothetical protein